ncbi:MAG TPA: lipid-A-disaccharide synthase [Pirellulaceae bacterium]|nr:lipid-A-disaccharide synthase [Pirellulaceae bacterium]
MRIFFSVGEPSGDLHGANLIRELAARDPGFEAVGYGGPKMAAAGCRLHADLTELAVMWFVRVLLNLHRFLGLLWRADRYFRDERPDAVVMIDYPGFNWWIARRAKARGIPVFYYGTPQMWAWAPWRVKKMRRYVDHVLCKLPFEPAWYERRQCRATYVGHPYFDQLAAQHLDDQFVDQQRQVPGRLVVILPGSRTQEVASNLDSLLAVAELVRIEVPEARFVIASYNERQAEAARARVAAFDLDCEVFVGRTQELMSLAECCVACSGSVSLELMYRAKPTVILYKVRGWALYMTRWVKLVKYITLTNLLAVDDIYQTSRDVYDPDAPNAVDVPFPEYLTARDRSKQIAAWVVRWLTDESERMRRVEWLARLRERYGHPGASRRAAEYILQAMDASKTASGGSA